MKSQTIYLKKLELFKELDAFKEANFFAVIDQKVKNHLPQWIQFSPHVFWIKNPEEEKNLTVYGQAMEFFLKQGISRNSKLYVIGGGATTDLGGFVAATILRGIRWSAIPTTLLAMIDGSIGGKVAVNMPQGKNLAGAFFLPEEVYICGEFLSSLSDKDWLSGKGEVLKYGLLSEEIHKSILKGTSIEDISHMCAKYKMEVVSKDLKEKGERVFLNLGHTLGHAFESTLKIPHGQAVVMGLIYLFKVMKDDHSLKALEQMIKALKLPREKFEIMSYPNFKLKDFFSFLEQDKKKVDAKIKLVLVKAIGSCYLEEITIKELKAKIQAHEEFKD